MLWMRDVFPDPGAPYCGKSHTKRKKRADNDVSDVEGELNCDLREGNPFETEFPVQHTIPYCP